MGVCPFHPKPHNSKAGLITTFLLKRRSWLDGLYAKSYKMRAGRVKMPGFDLFVVNDPKEVRKIMIDNVKEFPKSDMLHELLKPLLGVSIFTTNGEVWKKQRELLKPSFEMTRISKVFDLMSSAAADMMERFRKYPDGSIVEVDEHMTFVTADVIFRTIMSSKLDEIKGKEILHAFVTFQEETARTAIRKFFCVPQWLSNILGENKRMKAGAVIRKSLSDIIQPRYDSYKSDNYSDILSSLLHTVDASSGERFSFEEILDQVSMLFLAGHETTASSLTWTLYCLSLDQDAQQKAYNEIISINKDGKFSISDIKEMKYLTNVFKEALRLYPPVGFFARQSKGEAKIRDKVLQKGSGVVVAPWLIHRHDDFWEAPHEFRPDRHNENIPKEKYMPFGLGERICIGQGFAMQEAIIILANILREFKLELKDGFVPDVVGRLTVRSANGMMIKMSKRQ
ncbi:MULTISPECIES: cytochrome P450 [Campylobacter]|uniref:cytochrome P450 n=1 Tax=Campylobacter TaxID=194 RepID=UPI000A2FA21F|nr:MULTISPECIES: cytochrome P450 [unclassified Campylobacter]ARR04620.1 cytochrome p450 family protein [Campylobacter sp. RM12175]MCR8690479.1 cytochrome P450 [Campylobacter sp. RM9264]MCR8701351.1 cytochrome P450 [Campylobacter sp. RM12176]